MIFPWPITISELASVNRQPKSRNVYFFLGAKITVQPAMPIKLKARTKKWNYLAFSWCKTNLFCLASSRLNTAHFSNQKITENANPYEKKTSRLTIIFTPHIFRFDARVKTMWERLRVVKKISWFEIAAFFHALCRWVEKAVISK